MPTLKSVKITKAKKVKSGTSEHGPWSLWNFWIDDVDWGNEKFSHFPKGKEPDPAEGMEIASFTFDEQSDGQYTNYNVKKIEYVQKEEAKPKPKPAAGPAGSSGSNGSRPIASTTEMYISYAKDMFVKKIKTDEDLQDLGYLDSVKLVTLAGLQMEKIKKNPGEFTEQFEWLVNKFSGPKRTVNFEWLKNMGELKAQLSEERYYEILGTYGYEHCNMITNPAEQEAVISELRATIDQIHANSTGQGVPDDSIPF